jgi:hypothetical protein
MVGGLATIVTVIAPFPYLPQLTVYVVVVVGFTVSPPAELVSEVHGARQTAPSGASQVILIESPEYEGFAEEYIETELAAWDTVDAVIPIPTKLKNNTQTKKLR